MRKFVADTLAMVTFSFVIGMAIEVGISGLTLGQSIQSRVLGVGTNLLTGGLYGQFRDWLFLKTNSASGSRLQQVAVGLVAFVLFQVPLYILILLSTGATFDQIATSVISVAVVSTFIGAPYDLYMQWMRKLFRVAQ